MSNSVFSYFSIPFSTRVGSFVLLIYCVGFCDAWGGLVESTTYNGWGGFVQEIKLDTKPEALLASDAGGFFSSYVDFNLSEIPNQVGEDELSQFYMVRLGARYHTHSRWVFGLNIDYSKVSFVDVPTETERIRPNLSSIGPRVSLGYVASLLQVPIQFRVAAGMFDFPMRPGFYQGTWMLEAELEASEIMRFRAAYTRYHYTKNPNTAFSKLEGFKGSQGMVAMKAVSGFSLLTSGFPENLFEFEAILVPSDPWELEFSFNSSASSAEQTFSYAAGFVASRSIFDSWRVGFGLQYADLDPGTQWLGILRLAFEWD